MDSHPSPPPRVCPPPLPSTMPNTIPSFLPKSWSELQKNTDLELKLMSHRMQAFKDPFRDLANSLDKEWENFRKSSLPTCTSLNSESLLSKLKENQQITALSARMESFAILAFKPSLSPLPSSKSTANLNKVAFWKPPTSKIDLSSVRKAVVPHLQELYQKKDGDDDGFKVELKFPVDWKEIKVALRKWQNSKTVSRHNTYAVDEWEPLRRLRVSLVELETTAAASRTPREFFENLKKTEFFENTKRSLKISMPSSVVEKDQTVSDSPLDVPELLESLVKLSEPLLDQLGVKKGFSEKICSSMRSWKHNEQSATLHAATSNDVLVMSKEAGKALNELDLRIASVLQSTGYRYKGGFWGDHTSVESLEDDGKRNVAIVTTASLPWMTGTAVNPLFRAAYLAKSGRLKVTLLVPWLCKKDQVLVYPNQITFNFPEEQEAYIRQWLEGKVSFKPDFKIVFYSGKFSKQKRSILAVDDITQFIHEKEADIAILEEPEHLTWYHHGVRWTRKFRHVVGVVHTNYLEYVKREKNGALQALLLKYVNNWVTNIYCHKVVQLSAATQKLPKSVVCNVHGVSPKFLEIGQKIAQEKERGKQVYMEGAYYLGKMIWGKGYRELLDLLANHKKDLQDLRLDVFGSGEDSAAVKAEALKHDLAISFHEGRDHADASIQGYKVFINPSVSDVVCTTTAEALAMEKIVVCADHPSNDFFNTFPNCLKYKSSEEFVQKIKQAMNSEPIPLTPEQHHLLSWEAATDRFIVSADLDNFPPRRGETNGQGRVARNMGPTFVSMRRIVDYALFLAHYYLSGLEVARLASGAIPGTIHMDEEQRKDLGLAGPLMQRTVSYGG